jgi:hypothetical protein
MSDQYDGPAMAQQILRLQAAQHGMTLRDWFAGQALMGLMASRNPLTPRFHSTDDAAYVYGVADAMLAAREVQK